VRQRLRRLHDKRTLDELCGRGDEPFGHQDHRLRIPSTVEIGRWLVREYGAASLADLSCGYDASVATAITSELPTGYRMILGDYGEVSPLLPSHTLRGPIEETILKIAGADLFVCTETIEHLDDPDAVLAEIRGRCRTLLLSTPVGSWDDPTPGHYWAWNRSGVETILKAAGFEPIVYAELDFAAPDLFQTFGIWGAR
jgi:hypothetical protein